MGAFSTFSREQKLQLYQIFAVYIEIFISIFIIMKFGIGIGLGVMFGSMATTVGGIKYYELYIKDKVRDEIEGLRFLSGWIIGSPSDWRYVDFPVIEKELLTISDEDVFEYEEQKEFKDAIEAIKEQNSELYGMIDLNDLNDQYVNETLRNKYANIGIETSRQIFSFEMIMAYFDIDDHELIKCYERIVQYAQNQDTTTLILTQFEKILLKLKMICLSDQYNRTEISEYLEEIMLRLDIDKSIIYTNVKYKNKSIKLHDIHKMPMSYEKTRSMLIKSIIPYITMFISFIIALIAFVFTKTTYSRYIVEEKMVNPAHQAILNTLIALVIIFIILTILMFIKKIANKKNEIEQPKIIQIKNVVTQRLNFENHCALRSNLKQYSADAYIYKVYPYAKYRKIFPTDYIYMVLPASYEDTFDFEISTISHKGMHVTAQTACYVMIDIGRMYGEIPIYLITESSFHFKLLTPNSYNYNSAQNWKIQAYLHLISQLKSQIELQKPELNAQKIRTQDWQSFAIKNAQEFATDRNEQYRESLSSKEALKNGGEKAQIMQQQQDVIQQQHTMLKAQKSKMKKIIIGTVCTIVLLFAILIPIMV